MQDFTKIEDNYLQVRRVMASIAYENGEIDEQERQLLASSIGGEYQLPEDQLRILIEDATNRPRVEDLVTGITDPQFLRLLIIDLMILAIAKQEWEDSELTAAKRAIAALRLPQEAIAATNQAFDLLITASGAI